MGINSTFPTLDSLLRWIDIGLGKQLSRRNRYTHTRRASIRHKLTKTRNRRRNKRLLLLLLLYRLNGYRNTTLLHSGILLPILLLLALWLCGIYILDGRPW
jgi:hypothetical protein